jgi:hypothetical protein
VTHLAGVTVAVEPGTVPAADPVIAAIVVVRIPVPAVRAIIIGRAPVPGIVIPGRIVPGIIPAPGVIVSDGTPGTVIPGIPDPRVIIGPGRIVPRPIVAVQVPRAVPGIVPAVIVDDGDVRHIAVKTQFCRLALRDNDGITRRTQDIYFGFHGFPDQGVHLLLGNGGGSNGCPRVGIDAVLELLRARSVLG